MPVTFQGVGECGSSQPFWPFTFKVRHMELGTNKSHFASLHFMAYNIPKKETYFALLHVSRGLSNLQGLRHLLYFMQVFGLCTQNSPQQITQYLKAKLLVGKLAYVLVQSMALNDLSLAR